MIMYILIGLFCMMFGFLMGKVSTLEEIQSIVLKVIQENNNVFINKDEIVNQIKEYSKKDENNKEEV